MQKVYFFILFSIIFTQDWTFLYWIELHSFFNLWVMPAKATIYNMKSEPVFDFGTGPRNYVFYNPQGNNILQQLL